MRDNIINLFEVGVKPAIWIDELDIPDGWLDKYPNIRTKVNLHYILFQDDKMKNWFEQNGIIKLSREEFAKSWGALYDFQKDELSQEDYLDFDPKALGKVLGFPPSAVEAYVNAAEDWKEIRVGIDYHGIRFATLEELVAENIKWLKENVVVPEELRTGIQLSRLKDKRFVYEKIG